MERIQIDEIKKKNIQISNVLKDISKDILVLSEDLTIFPRNEDNTIITLPPAGHTNPITNNSHLYFTNTLRRFW